MTRIYTPLKINPNVANTTILKGKEKFEKERNDYSFEFCNMIPDPKVRSFVHSVRYWKVYDSSYFELIGMYLYQLEVLEKYRSRMKTNPLLASDKEYKRKLASIKKTIQILLEGLGISQAVIDMAEELAELEREDAYVIDNEDIEKLLKELS